MEGLRNALEFITGLKEKSMEPKVLQIEGKTYCDKDLTRYHEFDMARIMSVNTLTAIVDYKRKAGRVKGILYSACNESYESCFKVGTD